MSFTKALGLTVVAGAALMLAGCTHSPIPVAQNFELTSQHKVRSAGHWELVSRDVVAQTRTTLNGANATNAPLHVALPPNPSAFDLAFRDFLITELVQSGATVHQNPGASLAVTYHTQVVRHDSPRPHFIPGGFTTLAGGLIAAYGIRNAHVDAKLLATMGLTGALDYANSQYTGGPTNTELILTTTVTRDGLYVSRKTDVYYLENADTPLFLRPSHYRAVNMKVVSQ